MDWGVNLAYELSTNILKNSALNGSLIDLLPNIFGNNFDKKIANNLIKNFASGNFDELPPIEIVSRSLIAGGNGAYDISNNIIYLAEEFITTSSSAVIKDVLLEEIGHYIDARINEADTPGDEGYLFSQLLQGNILSDRELALAIAEDDRATVNLDREPTTLELAAETISFSGDLVVNAGWDVFEQTRLGTADEISEIGTITDSNPYEWLWEDLDGDGQLTLDEAATGYNNFGESSSSISKSEGIVNASGNANLVFSEGGGSLTFSGDGLINIPDFDGTRWFNGTGFIEYGEISVDFVANPGIFTISSTGRDFRYGSTGLGSGRNSDSYTFNIDSPGVYGFSLESSFIRIANRGGRAQPGESFGNSESFRIEWSFTPYESTEPEPDPEPDPDPNPDPEPDPDPDPEPDPDQENEPPVAKDDVIESFEDINPGDTYTSTPNPLHNILRNDEDENPSTLKVNESDFLTSLRGAVNVTKGGNFTYTAPSEVNFEEISGTNFVNDTFTYNIIDEDGLVSENKATVTIRLTKENQEPEAVDDNATTKTNLSVTIPILENDSDPDKDELIIEGIFGEAVTSKGGGMVNNGNALVYTPPQDFEGTDSFVYLLSDGRGASDTATVTINVKENQPPVAVNDSISINSGQTVSFGVLGNDSDLDDDKKDLKIEGFVYSGGNADIQQSGREFIYEPAPGFTGTDTFEYTIKDPSGATDSATVTVNVGGNQQVQFDRTVYEIAEPVNDTSQTALDVGITRNGDINGITSVDINIIDNDAFLSELRNNINEISTAIGNAINITNLALTVLKRTLPASVLNNTVFINIILNRRW